MWGWPRKKKRQPQKTQKWHTQNVYVKASMSYISLFFHEQQDCKICRKVSLMHQTSKSLNGIIVYLLRFFCLPFTKVVVSCPEPFLKINKDNTAYNVKWHRMWGCCESIVVSFPSCLVSLWGFHPYKHLLLFRKLLWLVSWIVVFHTCSDNGRVSISTIKIGEHKYWYFYFKVAQFCADHLQSWGTLPRG